MFLITLSYEYNFFFFFFLENIKSLQIVVYLYIICYLHKLCPLEFNRSAQKKTTNIWETLNYCSQVIDKIKTEGKIICLFTMEYTLAVFRKKSAYKKGKEQDYRQENTKQNGNEGKKL